MFKENQGGATAILQDLEDVIKPLPSNTRERVRANRQAALQQQSKLKQSYESVTNIIEDGDARQAQLDEQADTLVDDGGAYEETLVAGEGDGNGGNLSFRPSTDSAL